jgi:hypothetical protein
VQRFGKQDKTIAWPVMAQAIFLFANRPFDIFLTYWADIVKARVSDAWP